MEDITRSEVLIFLRTILRLSLFEAQQREIRGYGAFKESELPIPSFIFVLNALKSKYKITEEELQIGG